MPKKSRFLSLLLVIVLSLSVMPLSALADYSVDNAALLTYHAASSPGHSADVASQLIDGSLYLFLPSSADLHALALDFPAERCTILANGRTVTVKCGEHFDFLALFPNRPSDGRYTADFLINGSLKRVSIMQSAGLRSLYIASADTDKGHAYIDASKSNKAKDNPMVLLDADGRCIYEGTMKEIKGRGNSTWGYVKKPYQIKLKEKADLLELGNDEAAKTWVLLANYADGSLFRNALTNDLANALDIRYANHSAFVDLYYDGAYCGTYQLSEKTEIGDGRIEIRNLEKEIEELSGNEVDFDELPTIYAQDACGNTLQAVEGIKLPENHSGGYLLEMDYESRAKEEKSWFRSRHGQYVVCKAPEYLPAEGVAYVSELYQAFEDAVYNGGIHPGTGKDYTEYMDLPSLAKMYLLLALSQNGDAFRSSTYFYIPENEQKIYGGPVWDFDTAYGLYTVNQVSGFIPARSALAQKLLQIDSFREAVRAEWENCLRSVIEHTVLNPSAVYTTNGVGSVGYYGTVLSSSRAMDALRWNRTDAYDMHIDTIYRFIRESFRWVDQELADLEKTWPADGFVDVATDAWYTDAVSYVTENGYFSGFSDVLFQPEQKMTRSMLVTVLYRMADKPAVSGICSYTDVSADAWYSDAILWAEQTGITKGTDHGRFGVDDAVSREELLVFLHRFAEQIGIELPAAAIPADYADSYQVSVWAEDAMGWALGNKILNGATQQGKPVLNPDHTATRAETAAILQRFDQATVR